jgi:long-chain acyl-CoA synthetase
VLAPGRTLDTKALQEFARGHLAAYKVPRRVVVLEVLPRSLIGKVLRREIQDTLMAG